MARTIMTLAVLVGGFSAGGCVSIASLPQSAAEVSFDLSREAPTGGSQYEETILFRHADAHTTYLAAKAGLADAGFTIKQASFDKRMALGEHGMTAYDWNIVAGVYIHDATEGTYVKVLIRGSNDLGFWRDMRGSSWAQDIIKGMRHYILTDSLISDPNREHVR